MTPTQRSALRAVEEAPLPPLSLYLLKEIVEWNGNEWDVLNMGIEYLRPNYYENLIAYREFNTDDAIKQCHEALQVLVMGRYVDRKIRRVDRMFGGWRKYFYTLALRDKGRAALEVSDAD